MFELNQRKLTKQPVNKIVRQDIHPDFILRGLINCNECGTSLTGYWAKGGKYPYYECKNKDCHIKTLPKKKVDEDFSALLKKHKSPKEIVAMSRKLFRTVWTSERKKFEVDTNIQKKQLKVLEEEVEGLEDALSEAYSNSSSTEKINMLTNLLIKKQKKLQDTEIDCVDEQHFSEAYRTALENVTDKIQNPLKLWLSGDHMQQRSLFSFFFEENINYDREKGFRTPQLSPILRLLEGVESPRLLLCGPERIRTPGLLSASEAL